MVTNGCIQTVCPDAVVSCNTPGVVRRFSALTGITKMSLRSVTLSSPASAFRARRICFRFFWIVSRVSVMLARIRRSVADASSLISPFGSTHRRIAACTSRKSPSEETRAANKGNFTASSRNCCRSHPAVSSNDAASRNSPGSSAAPGRRMSQFSFTHAIQNRLPEISQHGERFRCHHRLVQHFPHHRKLDERSRPAFARYKTIRAPDQLKEPLFPGFHPHFHVDPGIELGSFEKIRGHPQCFPAAFLRSAPRCFHHPTLTAAAT